MDLKRNTKHEIKPQNVTDQINDSVLLLKIYLNIIAKEFSMLLIEQFPFPSSALFLISNEKTVKCFITF